MMKKNTRMFCFLFFFFEMIFFFIRVGRLEGIWVSVFFFLVFVFFFRFRFRFCFFFFFACVRALLSSLFLSDHSFSISTYYRPAIHHIHFSKVFLIPNNNNNDDDNNNNNNNNLCRISPFPIFFFSFFVFRFPFVCFFLIYFFKKTLTFSFEHPKIFVITKKVFSIGIFYIRYILSPPESNPHAFFLFFPSVPTQQKPQHTPHTHTLSPTHNTHNTYTKLFLYYIFFCELALPFSPSVFFFCCF